MQLSAFILCAALVSTTYSTPVHNSFTNIERRGFWGCFGGLCKAKPTLPADLPVVDLAAPDAGTALTQDQVNALGFTNCKVGPQAPQNYGPYHMICKLGAGAFGNVFLAKKGEDVFALKINKEVDNKLFIQEASMQWSLKSNPWVVKLHAVIKSDTKQGFVLQASNAGTANGFFNRFSNAMFPIPFSVATAVAKQWASGLCAVHNQGIAMRDIKPENILVFKEADKVMFRYADLGLAVDATENVKGVGGSPAFMPTEAFVVKGYDVLKSDVFSLGIMFYQLFNKGDPPPRDLGPTGKYLLPVKLNAAKFKAFEAGTEVTDKDTAAWPGVVALIKGMLADKAENRLDAAAVCASDWLRDADGNVETKWLQPNLVKQQQNAPAVQANIKKTTMDGGDSSSSDSSSSEASNSKGKGKKVATDEASSSTSGTKSKGKGKEIKTVNIKAKQPNMSDSSSTSSSQ